MKNKKHIVGVVLTLISVIVILMLLFVRLIPVEQREPEIDIDVDLLLPNELSKDKIVMDKVVSENSINSDLPNYYHSVSDADESFVYLGGAGGIYRIDSGLEVKKLYSASGIAGAALYGDYIFSLEYNASSEGMAAELIRINKISFEKEVLTQVSSGIYDLKIFDDTLILSEEVLGQYGIETVYQAYTLDKEGKLSTLVSADVIDYFLNIKSDIEKMGYLTYLTDLAKNVYKHSPCEEVYDIFVSGILKIEEGFNPKVITNIIELKYLDFLGISLYLDGCVECNMSNVVSISHNKGGYVCARHRTNEPLYDETILKMVKAYYYIDLSKITSLKIKQQVVDSIDSFLNIYYKEYTGLFLKTKNFLNNIKSS